MDEYTIPCTKEQIEKALELGAPIKSPNVEIGFFEDWEMVICNVMIINDNYYYIPTAEEMIGWLETQEAFDSIEIEYCKDYKIWLYRICTSKEDDCTFKSLFPSRKEATLAAIDAALDYLSNNKKNESPC